MCFLQIFHESAADFWPFNIFPYFLYYYYLLFTFFKKFIFISWRLITLQYCNGFCHTLTFQFKIIIDSQDVEKR